MGREMSAGSQRVVLLNGPAGVGKTMIGRRLAATARNGICVHGDELKRFVVRRDPDTVESGLSYVGGAALADVFLDAGYELVVFEFIFTRRRHIERFLRALRSDIPVHLFTLWAPLATVAAREAVRADRERVGGRVTECWHELATHLEGRFNAFMTAARREPIVYMLCGFVGAGKTTYARGLEDQGAVRLSIDEWVFARHGRHGVDYDEGEYPEHEASALAELDARLRGLIADGRDVVLDYGFWSREFRDGYKRRIQDAGARWRLLYFDVDVSEIRRRLKERNRHDGANALLVTDRHLDEFLSRWHPPHGEGEEVIRPATSDATS